MLNSRFSPLYFPYINIQISAKISKQSVQITTDMSERSESVHTLLTGSCEGQEIISCRVKIAILTQIIVI
jgi:hypothetical protein